MERKKRQGILVSAVVLVIMATLTVSALKWGIKDTRDDSGFMENESESRNGQASMKFGGLSGSGRQTDSADAVPDGEREVSEKEALELIEQKYGKQSVGQDAEGMEYTYMGMQDTYGETYHNFEYRQVLQADASGGKTEDKGNIFVSLDGKIITLAGKSENEDIWKLYGMESDPVMIFLMQEDGGSAVCSLVLNSDYTFSFSYDPMSSYLPQGTFEVSGDKVICSTADGMYTYTFNVVDDRTLSFNEGESSVIESIGTDFMKPHNGSIFTTE